MNELTLIKALSRIPLDVADLMADNTEQIRVAVNRQMLEQATENPDGKLSFTLTMGATIKPAGNQVNVETSIAWNIKTKKTAESTIDGHPQLSLDK